jgi:hypothetical protein
VEVELVASSDQDHHRAQLVAVGAIIEPAGLAKGLAVEMGRQASSGCAPSRLASPSRARWG